MRSDSSRRGRRVWAVGDAAEITSGPAAGLTGVVLSVDVAAGVAQLRVEVRQEHDRTRYGFAAVAVRDLVTPGEGARRYVNKGRTSGRPRTIPDETVEKIIAMYETGAYSQQAIADLVGVSKTSVAIFLRRARTSSESAG